MHLEVYPVSILVFECIQFPYFFYNLPSFKVSLCCVSSSCVYLCSVSSFYEITYKRDFHLQVHFDGKIRWSFGGVLTTSCDIDLTLYPFDKQHCAVEVESWQYEKAKVKLSLINGTAINLDTAEPDPQWILDGAEVNCVKKL